MAGENPAPEAPAGDPAPASGLPSDNPDNQPSPWERARADGFLPADFKEDPYELAKSLKNAQDYVAEANKEKGRQGNEQKQIETQQQQQQEILSMVPEFLSNDMQLTPEMEIKATEFGIDIRDLKLGAIDFRDNINRAYDVVGGEAAYSEMMTGMQEHMTDAQKKSFNKDIGGEMSEYAIKGLNAEWQNIKAGGQPQETPQRLEGNQSTPPAVKGYATKAEMLADTRYLASHAGKRDGVARANYNKRMAATPDSVVYGR